MDDANLEDLARELGEKRDMLLVHALVHYIHAGHLCSAIIRYGGLPSVFMRQSAEHWSAEDAAGRQSGH